MFPRQEEQAIHRIKKIQPTLTLDVVQCLPGMVTRIIVHFDGYPGKYLYHCHVLEHEANDMMRPFEVIA